VRRSAGGRREQAHDLFDAHLQLPRYEQQPGVGFAVRTHVLMRCGPRACRAQRTSASARTATPRQEVEGVFARLTRHGARTLQMPLRAAALPVMHA